MEIVYYVLLIAGLVSGVYDDKKVCDAAAKAGPAAHCERRVIR